MPKRRPPRFRQNLAETRSAACLESLGRERKGRKIAEQSAFIAGIHEADALHQCEMLRFCPEGEGGKFIESGATGPGGKLPVNTSGGLVSKGHPVGATGLSMIAELACQLRGEAGLRQVKGAEIALAENGGGVIGMEEAVASVVILQRG